MPAWLFSVISLSCFVVSSPPQIILLTSTCDALASTSQKRSTSVCMVLRGVNRNNTAKSLVATSCVKGLNDRYIRPWSNPRRLPIREEAGLPSCVSLSYPSRMVRCSSSRRWEESGPSSTVPRGRPRLPGLERRQVFFHRIGGARTRSGTEGDERLGRMHGTELRVRRGAVVTLDEVLHDQLPIGRGGIGLRIRDLRPGETVEIEVGREIAEGRVEIRRRLIG